jgi:hypothetical protein
VVDSCSSSIDPTLPLESDTKAVDLFPPINPILPLENETQVVDVVLPSVDPIPRLMSAKMIDPVPSSVNPTLPMKSAKVVYPIPPLVDLIQSLVDPTLDKPDIAHVFLVNIDYTVPGGIPPSPMKPPPSNEAILFDWGVLTRLHIPSHIPFQITVQVCGRDIPQTLIDEGASIIILSPVAWYALGCPWLAPVTQNLLACNRRTSQTLGILP